MHQYPKLPEPPPPQPDQTREQYGLTILAFVIAEGLAATCNPEQLALALHASPIAGAVLVTGDKADRQVDRRELTADAVAAAKRLILQTQRIAQAIAAEASQASQEAQPAAGQASPDQDQPGDGGPRVPRNPYPLAPAPATRLQLPIAPPAPPPVLNF